MGLIKTDPSQTKTVAALIGVLVVAAGVTVVRIKPGPAPQASAASQATAAATAPAKVTGQRTCDHSRNPFETPASLTALIAAKRAAPGTVAMASRDGARANPWREDGEASVQPMDIGPVLPAGSVSDPEQTATSEAKTDKKPAEPDKPRFTLLATVKGSNGFIAVIRTGDSSVKVVEVGDPVDGGFKVKKIEAGYAVLTDGRDVVIAKRPQS